MYKDNGLLQNNDTYLSSPFDTVTHTQKEDIQQFQHIKLST